MEEESTINELIIEYFRQHPKQDISHGPIVDWVTREWLRTHEKPPRDPWRAIRKLHQIGVLIKVRKGIYRYDPDYVHNVDLFEFPTKVKEEIFRRDSYKCIVCGRGRKDGVEICADHKISKDKGGTNTIENGQTLCTEHNLLKKNYSRTEAGKRYFIQLYEDAIKSSDESMIEFCKEIFKVYDKHNIDKHIKIPNDRSDKKLNDY